MNIGFDLQTKNKQINALFEYILVTWLHYGWIFQLCLLFHFFFN